MKKIYRIGVELKEGCTINGADLAIGALIDAGLSFDEVLSVNESEEAYPLNALHLPQVIDMNQRLQTCNKNFKIKGGFPLTFGGDHALAIGSISAVLEDNTAVLWVDAHGDCNTDQTTITGRIHGMPLAVLQGDGHTELTKLVSNPLSAERIVLFGVRCLDPKEEMYIKEKQIRIYTMDDIRKLGFKEALKEALTYLKPYSVHLSFDLDSIDPKECKGVNTPVRHGFSKEEVYQLIEESFVNCNIESMDIVEYNPTYDEGETVQIIKKIDRIVANHKGV